MLLMNRDKINRIYESVQKVNQVYEVWAGKHKLTLYEMLMFYEIFRRKNMEITQKRTEHKTGGTEDICQQYYQETAECRIYRNACQPTE